MAILIAREKREPTTAKVRGIAQGGSGGDDWHTLETFGQASSGLWRRCCSASVQVFVLAQTLLVCAERKHGAAAHAQARNFFARRQSKNADSICSFNMHSKHRRLAAIAHFAQHTDDQQINQQRVEEESWTITETVI